MLFVVENQPIHARYKIKALFKSIQKFKKKIVRLEFI